jgi:cell division protein ZapA
MSSPGADRKPVRVTIFNQHYSLLASEEPGEVEELAASIDQLMHSIADRSGTSDAARVAVLACLHLADRLRAIERERQMAQQRIEEKTRRFSVLLDEAFGPAD